MRGLTYVGQPRVTPVAVVGMACRLPGGIDSPELLWAALLDGDDAPAEPPRQRWDADVFDCDFFGIGEREAVAIDPQQRLLLEVSWEAVDRAGLPAEALTGSSTGVFVGLTHGPHGMPGNGFGTASGWIAHAVGSHGPAMTVDTDCSSGLTAVHLACRSLHEGESDLALAADGFAPGEGAAALVLKRLPDALAGGDRILGVILGTAATHAPPARAAACLRALAAAGVDASTVGMVQAYGAAAAIGGPAGHAGVAEVYGVDAPCALGWVGTGGGMLALIKTVLAVGHGVVPRAPRLDHLPGELGDVDTKLFVPQASTAWPAHGRAPRRAAVSAYGASGTNLHAIVEEAPPHGAGTSAPPGAAAFLLSASSADALRETAHRLAGWVHERAHTVVPSDLAYTLARRRTHRPVRTAVIAGGVEELVAGLREVAGGATAYRPAVGGDDRGPVWVFSGAGSQWAAMGADLLVSEPVFAATVATLEPLIAEESGFSVTAAMTGPEVVAGTDQVQPTLFAMQVALAATLGSYGIRPGAVIGYSLGEAAAAAVAGALSLQDGVRLVCRSSRLMATAAGPVAMASVELPALRVRSELTALGVDDVVVAAVTSPQAALIAGSPESVRALRTAWQSRGVTARDVAVDAVGIAHTPHVDPVLDELARALALLRPTAPQVPYYSATLFDPRERPACDAGYWADNLRHTVRFSAAVRAALDDGHRVFAELSPHPLLTDAVGHTAAAAGTPVAALAVMRRGERPPHGLLGVLAELYHAGAAVDFSVPYPRGRLLDAPPAAWTRRRLPGRRPGADGHGRTGVGVAVHPLLGAHVPLPEEPERHAWHADVGTGALTWLVDHRVHDVPAFPRAAYCEMALAAARTVLGDQCEVRDVSFEAMLLPDKETAVTAVASVTAPSRAEFTVQTPRDGGGQLRLASAALHAAHDDDRPSGHDVPALLAAHPSRVDGGELRRDFTGAGVRYGPAFAGLAAVHVGDASVLAEVVAPAAIRPHQGHYGIHPALLDACFQAVGAHPEIRNGNGGSLPPSGLRRLRAYASARTTRYCYARVTGAAAGALEADLELLDDAGAVLVAAWGLRLGNPRSGGADRATSEFRAELDDVPPQEWPARIRQLVSEQAGLILRRAVDPDRPLPEYGLDSLGALELRTRLEVETGIRLAPTDISTTAHRLAEHLYDQLGGRRDTGGTSARRPTRCVDGQ